MIIAILVIALAAAGVAVYKLVKRSEKIEELNRRVQAMSMSIF